MRVKAKFPSNPLKILPKPALFIASFAALGVILLLTSRAATPYASLEIGTSSNVAAPATILTGDSSASGGSYVKFGSGSVEPPPSGGCPPYPAFPDANCTGWQHTGVTLTDYTGNRTITTAGTVIDSKLISGGLIICANNVTIKRSKIIGTVNTGYSHTNYACGSSSGFSGILLEDVEIDGGNSANSAAIGDHGYTCRRCNVHHVGLGFNGSNFTVEDSYIHDIYGERDCQKYPSDCISHNSVSNPANGSNMTLRHNTLTANYAANSAGGGMSAAVTLYTHGDNWGAINNVLLEKNRIESKTAVYCTYGGYSKDPNTGVEEWATNVRFIDNYFIANPGTGTCGSGGPVTGWRRGDGNIWSGNVLLTSGGATVLSEPSSNSY